MKSPLEPPPAGSDAEETERQLAKLAKINAALMQRVEKSMDQQANAFSLFQTAITLEGQVRMRTEELKTALSRLERTNDELTTARDTSERANRFKTRFFTAVGHDLLQPLHAARLSVSALTDQSSTPDQRRLADRVEHALTTIEDLLKSILDISKLEAGVVVPTLRPVPINELFSSLTLGIEPLARLKSLALTWRRSELAVLSDPLMLRRILQNLLTNAVQYTDRGGIKLAARRRGNEVRIEVWDTGPGIPASDQELIFEEFQRGPSPDRLSIGGFGLGLSIVQRMAEALDHPLGLCSRIGHGTRFSITAPFAGVVDSAVERTVPISCAATYGLNGAKVLVIDNDEAVLEAMQSLLQRWTCKVVLVRDVAELDRFIAAASPPDLVLADYHLDRGFCGVAAIERVRAAVSDPELPAVIITADHSPAVADNVRTGRCELLLKPVKPAELRALMHHLVRGPAAAASAQRD